MVASNKHNFGRIMAESVVHKLRKVFLFDPHPHPQQTTTVTAPRPMSSKPSYFSVIDSTYLKEPQR